MPLKSALFIFLIWAAGSSIPACAARGDLQIAANEYRITVPGVGSMDTKAYPVEPRQYKPDCPRRERDQRPSPDTGYGTPGSPLASPGQIIPGRLPPKDNR